MLAYALTHLSDAILLRDLAALVAQDRTTTAALLAHVAEVDARRLYLPAGYPSMHAYCVDSLLLSEDAAYKRIQAARAARQFPAIFTGLAEGRLHLAAVCLLAPHLTPENADELVAAAAHQRKSEIEVLLARRFPRPEVRAMVQAIPYIPPQLDAQLAPGQVGAAMLELAGGLGPGQSGAAPRAKSESLSPERFVLQVTIRKSTHDKLRYAQELLSHAVPSGDVVEVLDRALDALIGRLEKRKFAATNQPRLQRHSAAGRRNVPAHVRRAVWDRDQGQCTFVSATGHRCPARRLLEFDHVDPVARGGEATMAGIRLRCRAHNQYGAECTFGAEFMRHQRRAAAAARIAAKGRATAAAAGTAAARAPAAAAEQAPGEGEDRDVVPWLRQLGFSAAEVRRAAARCEDIPDASLEQRLRVALSCFRKRSTRVGRAWDTA